MRTRICDGCDGMGYIIAGNKKRKCDTCLGKGYVPKDQPKVDGK